MCRLLTITIFSLFLFGCATPPVNRDVAGFDETQYSQDLFDCRGGTAWDYSVSSFKGALYGSAIGASDGFTWGLVSGDGGEGAMIGAIVGGTIGIGVGFYDEMQTNVGGVERCLSDKGYLVSSL